MHWCYMIRNMTATLPHLHEYTLSYQQKGGSLHALLLRYYGTLDLLLPMMLLLSPSKIMTQEVKLPAPSRL